MSKIWSQVKEPCEKNAPAPARNIGSDRLRLPWFITYKSYRVTVILKYYSILKKLGLSQEREPDFEICLEPEPKNQKRTGSSNAGKILSLNLATLKKYIFLKHSFEFWEKYCAFFVSKTEKWLFLENTCLYV